MKKPDYQSPESLVLKFMREKRQLSLHTVGTQIGIKPKVVDHIEGGRRVITDEEIALFLEHYSFSLDMFQEMTQLKPLTKKTSNLYFLSRKVF